MGMGYHVTMGLFLRLHLYIRAWLVKYFRTREVVKVFTASHNQELAKVPMTQWPMLKAEHERKIAAIRAGQLDITDRKSWVWPFMPATVARLSVPIIKITPYNIRRFSRTPVPRRAINLIKGAIISQPWDIVSVDGVDVDDEDEQEERINVAKKIFRHPNNVDSFQSWMEQGIEDQCIFGAFVSELAFTPDPERPMKMWAVAVESIRIFATWLESLPDMPHYAQMTGLKGERGAILFYDDELLYCKDNPSTDTPFGLGCMEVVFSSLNDLLGVQRMAGLAGSDQVHKTWLWWEQPQPDSSYEIVRRHIQNELEGQSKVSIIGGMKKPEVIEIQPVEEVDLLLNWQEMLIRMVADGFDLSAMALGVEHDVNRAVGQVLNDKDFRSCIVPRARRLEEVFTRKILHDKLGWSDLEFKFLNLDDPDAVTKMDLLTKMYSANALTPDEIRVAFGRKPMDNQFSNLTQFEAMLINVQAMAEVQDGMQQKQMQRQLDQMDQMNQMSPQYPPEDQDPTQPAPAAGKNGSKGGGPPQAGAITPQSAAKGGQPPSPKPMALPKFPISGSRYTARQIARMPVNRVTDLLDSGQWSGASKLLADMQQQDPNILSIMSDSLRAFFEQQIEQEKEELDRKNSNKKYGSKAKKDQTKRYKDQDKRTSDYSDFMYKNGPVRGGPSSRADRPSAYGRPGKLNNDPKD